LKRNAADGLFTKPSKVTCSVIQANPGSGPGQAPEPESPGNPGFRAALRLPGMTIYPYFQISKRFARTSALRINEVMAGEEFEVESTENGWVLGRKGKDTVQRSNW